MDHNVKMLQQQVNSLQATINAVVNNIKVLESNQNAIREYMQRTMSIIDTTAFAALFFHLNNTTDLNLTKDTVAATKDKIAEIVGQMNDYSQKLMEEKVAESADKENDGSNAN